MAVFACAAFRPWAVSGYLGPAFDLGPKTEWGGVGGSSGPAVPLLAPAEKRLTRQSWLFQAARRRWRRGTPSPSGPFWNLVFVATVAAWTEAALHLTAWLMLTSRVCAQQGPE